MKIIRTDTGVAHNIPPIVMKVIEERYPNALMNVQNESIETIERLTKGVKIPDHIITELVGALNAFYLSGYWHACEYEIKAAGIKLPPGILK